MQVTETLSEGLKREFQVTVPMAELETQVNEKLNEMKDRVRLNGFRPGKVPASHLKRVYGRAAMAETIEAAVREANAKIVTERGLRLASEPKVTLPTEEKDVEALIGGQSDLTYSVAIELIPQFALADFKSIKLERLSADVSDAEVDESIQRLADQNRPYAPKADGAKAESGDRLTISFVGKIDGVAFEGGTGENIPVQIGSNSFIPGFEEQLIGMAKGETKTVDVSFPGNYLNEALAGKAASFEVTASELEAPGALAVDDEFAKGLGLESLDKLKEAVKARLAADYGAVARRHLKRQLLDQLDTLHPFESPPSMLEEEFTSVWSQVMTDMANQSRTFESENTTEEAAKAEYRKIADRRVRLGLVLSEIGEKNNLRVTDEEVSRAFAEQARQFPGREKELWDYYRKNPNAMASLRAPIFEDKTIDFLVELAQVTDRKVSREELLKAEEADATKGPAA